MSCRVQDVDHPEQSDVGRPAGGRRRRGDAGRHVPATVVTGGRPTSNEYDRANSQTNLAGRRARDASENLAGRDRE